MYLHGLHTKRTQCYICANTGVFEAAWVSNYTTTALPHHAVGCD